jgi:probable O-glycosylation ligase (exosortase A-associated)
MFALLACLAIAGGFAILEIPRDFQLVIIFAIPAAIFAILILLNPFIGVYVYLLFEYLRPYDLIPALLPLKLPIVIIGITAISWVIRLSRTKTMIWTNFSWLYLGFVALIAFTVFTADIYFYALQVFKEALVVFVMFVVAVNVVNNYSRLRKLVWLLLAIHLFLALEGISNYIFADATKAGQQTSGAVGTFFLADENDFALALNVMLPFAFFSAVYARRFYTRMIALGITVSLIFGVVSSFSRGGWVGLVAALGFCLLRTKRKVLSLSIAVVLSIALIMVAPEEYWDEISTISDTRETTAVTRLNYWKAAVNMYLDYPIVGVGASNGGAQLPNYITGYRNPATQWGRAFHGTLPQVLAELGTVGIALYLGMIITAFRYLSRIRRDAIREGGDYETIQMVDSVIGGIVAFLVTGTFLSTAYYPQLWTLFTLAMIIVRCRESHLMRERNLGGETGELVQTASSS